LDDDLPHRDEIKSVLGQLWSNQIPQGVLATTEKLMRLKSAKTVSALELIQDINYHEP